MECIFFGFVIICGLFQYEMAFVAFDYKPLDGSTIMCYECNSATNSLCLQGHLPQNLRRNCSDHDKGVTHTLCRKIIQHVDYGVNGRLPESRVIRSCGWDETKYKGECYHRAGYGGRQEVCSCTKDLCNGSEQTSFNTIFIGATVIVVISIIM